MKERAGRRRKSGMQRVASGGVDFQVGGLPSTPRHLFFSFCRPMKGTMAGSCSVSMLFLSSQVGGGALRHSQQGEAM